MLKLTQTRPQSNDKFPTLQLFILAICRIAEPIALTSIFPYSWVMVKGFNIGSPNDASFYSGVLISAFALAESLTGMWWGSVSDRVGRKPILLLGCFGTMISLLLVGFSRSFGFALFGRILGGMLNGNIGVIQTMVGELITKPEHEARAFSIMPFVWSIGTIIGPALGGLLANPVKTLPGIFATDGVFDTFPYLLPNLLCALFMCGSMTAGYFLLEETHPDFRKGADPSVQHDIAEQTPMISGAGIAADPAVDLRQESYGTFNEVEIGKTEQWEVSSNGSDVPKSGKSKWFTWKIAMLVAALGIYSYHSMCYDHLLPIFFQEKKSTGDVSVSSASVLMGMSGGLGMTTQASGAIMAVNGVIALFIQAIVFPFACDRLGVWRVFTLTVLFHPIAYFIVPYILLLPQNMLFTGIYTCLTVRNLFSILEYPVILILLRQASPSPSCLGRINGLAASVAAAFRTIAPPVAGILYSKGLEMNFTGLAWWAAGVVALLGGAQLYFVPRERNDATVIRSAAPCFAAAISAEEPHKDVVKVAVVQVEEVV